jgi:hypothetical protein
MGLNVWDAHGVYAAPSQGSARGNARQIGTRPVWQGRPDRAQSGPGIKHPRGRSGRPSHLLPPRPCVAEVPSLPRDPHTFLGSVLSTIPLQAAIARGYLEQIATFFASDGKTIIHPEPARFFEVPIKGPLPEELNYIA